MPMTLFTHKEAENTHLQDVHCKKSPIPTERKYYAGKEQNPPMCIKQDQIKERFQECKTPLYGCYTKIRHQ